MADRKYLAVYGKGTTEVVGRIVEFWKNENPNSEDRGTMSMNRPERNDGLWSRHLALQDMAGGLNYIGPYPSTGTGHLSFADVMRAIPEEMAASMLKESAEGRLHVLRHVTGELPSVIRIDLDAMTPNIEKQLEYGEKTSHVIKRAAEGKSWTDVKWKWDETLLSKEHHNLLDQGIRAVTPADDPVVSIIVTGCTERKGNLVVEGINPLDWGEESFVLKDVTQLKAELAALRDTPGSIRMFRPSKYYKGRMSEAAIVHSQTMDLQKEKNEQNQLKLRHQSAMDRLHEYRRKKDSDKNAIQLQIAGILFLREQGFMETLLLTKKILAMENNAEALKQIDAIMADSNKILLESRSIPSSPQKLADVLGRLETLLTTPALRNVRFGEITLSRLTPMSPQQGVSERCTALLRAIREYGGDLCSVDKIRKAFVWKMDGSTFEKPVLIKPKESGLEVLPALAEKHLNALANRKPDHMYMATRDSLLVLSANHEEGAEATAKRLSGKIGEKEEYMSPDARGHIRIPLYRSGYTRRIAGSDVMIQVAPTIAKTWVLPTTARKYYMRLMKELSSNNTNTDAGGGGSGNVGADVAELVKGLLLDGGGTKEKGQTPEERLSKLGQIAAEIAVENKGNDKIRQGQKRI